MASEITKDFHVHWQSRVRRWLRDAKTDDESHETEFFLFLHAIVFIEQIDTMKTMA